MKGYLYSHVACELVEQQRSERSGEVVAIDDNLTYVGGLADSISCLLHHQAQTSRMIALQYDP